MYERERTTTHGGVGSLEWVSCRAQRRTLFFNSCCNRPGPSCLSTTVAHRDPCTTLLPAGQLSTLRYHMATTEVPPLVRPAIRDHSAREVIDVDSLDEEIQLVEQPSETLHAAGSRSHSRRATRGPSGSSSASAIVVDSDDDGTSRLRPGQGMDYHCHCL